MFNPFRLSLVLAALLSIVVGVSSASAATAQPESVGAPDNMAVMAILGQPTAQAAYFGGYCGPPVMSKASMIAFYQSPQGKALARGAESYVRADSHYYHIQRDQGFINWLQQPNMKFFNAPAGYRLTGNTYCPGNTPQQYNGHLDVGGLGMLWWCTDSSGHGHNCTPITKGYCRNFVHGPMVHRMHRQRVTPVAPVRVQKITEDANGNRFPMPSGTFQFRVKAKGHSSKVVILNHSPQSVGKFRVGSWICVTELKPLSNEQWKRVSPATMTVCAKVHGKGNTFTFKNREVRSQPPVVLPPTPTGNCNVVVMGNGNSVNVSQCNTTIKIVCSGVNITFGGPNSNSVNQAVMQYEESHNCNTTVVVTPTPTPTPSPSPTPTPSPSPTPTPTPHVTNISCVGFEEVTGGASFLVDCDVSDDNGAPISLIAHSNDANSRVSGTNCYSQGGTSSCHGNGTFEFRVSGINDGSSVVYSSVTATASANGVSMTFTSDPFPVDPSGGGFKGNRSLLAKQL